jgi:predicted MFS family arabinose efflux permease
VGRGWALSPIVSTYWLLLLARGIAGFAASGVTPSVYGIVGTSAPPDRRATWLSIVTSGLLLALATGAPAGTLVAAAVGWRGVFAVLCGGAVAVLVGTLAALRRADDRPAGPGPRRAAGGPLADRFGGRRVTTISLLALAAVEALLALLIHHRVVALAGLGVFALAAYPYFSAHQTRLIASSGDHAASLMAWNNTAMYVGILLAAAVGGSVVAHAGFPALIGGAAAVALLGAIAAGSPAQLPPAEVSSWSCTAGATSAISASGSAEARGSRRRT